MLRGIAPFMLFIACAFVTSGCAPKQTPRLLFPAHVEAFCGAKKPRITAIMSVMTSTNDIMTADGHPSDAAVHARARKEGGAIAFWSDQPLLLPKTAHALGETGDYVHVTAAALFTPADTVVKRPILLKIRVHGKERWIGLDAFDVQNPCVEGHRAM